METNLLRTGGTNDHVINQVIAMEWKMFQQVENIGGRAACQDDMDTFYIMRYSQHAILRGETLERYKADLIGGQNQGRNLIMEKYAYMMEATDPEYYHTHIEGQIPRVTGEKAGVIGEIQRIMDGHYRAFAAKYPKYTSRGRSAEGGGSQTTIGVYLVGELKTYSLQTLESFLADIKRLGELGKNPVEMIQEIMTGFYGYGSIGDAEEKM
ncbi:MAG: DUF4125 family protein [Anaerovoracaceae bacterium]|jgi:hypothetical protein